MDKEETPSEMFLKYDYPETKDMCKQFLTLVTTVLVISLTFSDKIINFTNASTASKWLIILAWTSLLSAIIFCGVGLLLITMAAGEAAYNKTKDWRKINRSFKMIVFAGAAFVLGLILLISTVVTATLSKNNPIKNKTTENISFKK